MGGMVATKQKTQIIIWTWGIGYEPTIAKSYRSDVRCRFLCKS